MAGGADYFCNRGGVDQSAGQKQWSGFGGDDRAGAVGGGEKHRHAGVLLCIELTGAVAQIKTGRRECVALAAEQARLTEGVGGGLGGVEGIEDADFFDAGGQCGGDGGCCAEDVEDDDGFIGDLAGLEFAGEDDGFNPERSRTRRSRRIWQLMA